MRRPDLSRRRRLVAVIALATTAVAALSGGGTAGASAMHHGFRQTNLVSDIPGRAQLTDPNLVNPWGLAAGPTTPLWVADNGTGLATLYAAAPAVPRSASRRWCSRCRWAHPRPGVQWLQRVQTAHQLAAAGQVHLRLRGRHHLGLDADQSDPAQRPHQAGRARRDFKGLAIGFFRHHPALYAADFGHSRVWVVDSHFHVMNTPGAFLDSTLPSDYSPFGIQSIGRWVVVGYAKHEPGEGDETTAPASGSSTSTRRTAGWCPPRQPRRAERARGLVREPRSSAASAVRCWSATSVTAASTRTTSRPASGWASWRPNGDPIAINGLRFGRVGNGVAGGPNDLLFSAGIQHEVHGLLGTIRHVS